MLGVGPAAMSEPRCAHCGGELSPRVNTVGMRACLACGKANGGVCGTELTCGGTCGRGWHHAGDCACFDPAHHHEADVDPDACGEQLDCGGTCWLKRGHPTDTPHLCKGDSDGPGTCPA